MRAFQTKRRLFQLCGTLNPTRTAILSVLAASINMKTMIQRIRLWMVV